MTMRSRTMRGRVYLEVDVEEVRPDDVVDYVLCVYLESGAVDDTKSSEHRTHRVDGVRAGEDAAVRVVPHAHEKISRLWIPRRSIKNAWRRRSSFKRRRKTG